MAKIHDLFIVELAEVIKGYGNDPDVEDPFRLSEFYRFYELPNIAVSRENFENMRPIEERKKGRWIIDDDWNMCDIEGTLVGTKEYECDKCGYRELVFDGTVTHLNYCPNCGADMRGNDLNEEMPTDYHMDGLEFLQTLETASADLVLYDRPYSITQAAQLYKSYGKKRLEINVANMKYWASVKNEIARILKVGGRVICCGWNTNGIGKGRGFEMTAVMIVNHGGSKNDTLVTLEYKTEGAGEKA